MSATHLLRVLISEMLMSEQKPVWYHRTKVELKPGSVLRNTSDPDPGHDTVEAALERYRLKHHPDKPSRLTSVFLSPSLESHFVNFGPAYEVVPQGTGFLADVTAFDQLMKLYTERAGRRERLLNVPDDEPLLQKYWKGATKVTDANKRRLELLVPAARVVGPAQQQSKAELKAGDTVTSNVTFEAAMLVVSGEVSAQGNLKDDGDNNDWIDMPIDELPALLPQSIQGKIVDTPKSKKMPRSLFLSFKPGWTATIYDVTVKSKYDTYGLVLAVQLKDRRWIVVDLKKETAQTVLTSPTTHKI